MTKMMIRIGFKPEERLLLNIQRTAVISSDSSEIVMTDNGDLIT
jgi:hypothetical protein